MSKTFETRGVYHSALVQVSDPGGLLVRLKGEPHPSKYKDKPPFQVFEVHGDEGSEYFYNIENGDIHSYLAGAPKDQWLMLFALGSRDSATIRLEEQDGNLVIPEPQAEGGPPPNHWPPEYEERRKVNELGRFKEIYDTLAAYTGPVGDVAKAALIEATQKIFVTELIQK